MRTARTSYLDDYAGERNTQTFTHACASTEPLLYRARQVTDFGISAGLQSSFAMCGTFVGTFKYMSPERMRNDKYGYSSDIWSLGLVLMECAAKEYPYRVRQDKMRAVGCVWVIDRSLGSEPAV